MTQRTAVVSGGIGGLGTAICLALVRDGHRVVAADLDRDPERVDAFRQAINGHPVEFAPLDVTDRDACASLVADVEQRHGGVDILVNAAGITRDATLRKLEPDAWDAVLSVNLDGVYNLTRPAADGMAARGFGRIVNISSVNGQSGQFGQANYAAAKAGIIGFTKSAALETARKGITVNAIAPGFIETEMIAAMPEEVRATILAKIPMGRFGRPEEIAQVVTFLVAHGDYMTGQVIEINGGLYT
jgi:acetoacetyl-CoA reductase